MRETFLLTKAFFKNSFRSSDNKKSKIGLFLFLLFYFGIVFVFLSKETLTFLKTIALEELFIKAIVLMDIFLIAIQSVVSSLNMFYFSDDIEHILPFPVKTKSLYYSKLNILIFSEYIFEGLFFIVPLIYFGINMGLNCFYYLRMISFLLVLPIIICSIIAFITVRLVGIFKHLKNKDMVQYVSMIMAMILVFVVTTFTYGETGQGMTEQEIMEMVMSLEDVTSASESLIAPFINIFKTFLIGNTLNSQMVSFIKIIVIFMITYVLLTNLNYKIYKKNLSINFNNGKKITKKDLNRKIELRRSTVFSSYLKKEFKMLIRTPMFFMQCILPSIIVPIIISMPFFLNLNNLEALDLPSIENIKNIAQSKEGFLVVIGIVQMFFMMNINSITAISRDNNNAVFMKYIPISLYKQCIYKIMPGIIFNFIPIIYVSCVLGMILEFTFLNICAIIVSLLLLSSLESLVLIVLDLRNPKINWDSETTVVKQNMNIIVGYIFQIMIYVFMMLFTVYFGKNILDSTIIFDLVLVILILCVNSYIKKNQNKLFSKIY